MPNSYRYGGNSAEGVSNIIDVINQSANDFRERKKADLERQKLQRELDADQPLYKVVGREDASATGNEAAIEANKKRFNEVVARQNQNQVPTQEQDLERQSVQNFESPRDAFLKKFGVVPETKLSQYQKFQSAEGTRAKTENPTPDVYVNPSDPTQISFQKVAGWLPVKPRDALTQFGNANKSEVQFGEKQDQQTQKRLEGLSNALDPSKQRQGAFGVSKQIFDRAERLQSLSNAFSGGNLDSRQVEELAIGLNGMLSGSNTGAQQQVQSLVPQSAMGNAEKLREWLTNQPQGLNQQEFVKRMLGTIEREKNTSEDQMNRTRFQRIAAYADLEQKNPAAFNDVLNSQGVDIGKYKAWKTGGHKFMSAVQNPEQNAGKLKTVTQNGHTYTLNEQTGQYE